MSFRIGFSLITATTWIIFHFSLLYLLKGKPKRWVWALGANIFVGIFVFSRRAFRSGAPFVVSETYYILLSLVICSVLTIMLVALLKLLSRKRIEEMNPSRRALLRNAAIAGPVALASYGYYQARNVRLVENTISFPNLPAEWDGLKILQITDLHVGQSIRREFVQEVVDLCNSADADLCALTGDILDAPLDSIIRDAAPLKDIRTKLGSFFVTGNHEYMWGADKFIDHIHEVLGHNVLMNRGVVFDRGGKKFLLAGVNDINAGRRHDTHRSLPTEAGAQDADFKMLLAHNPNSYETAHPAGFNLMISGHTHAGQFFPASLFVHAFYRYVKGNYDHHGMKIYVSPGTGLWGPVNRACVQPEVSLHILRRG